MKNRYSPVTPPNRPIRPAHFLRWGLVLLTLLTLAGAGFFGNSNSGDNFAPAVRPTNPAEDSGVSVKLSSQLPRNKVEAAAFEKLYHSSYNFAQVNSLNAAYVATNGGGLVLDNSVQSGPTVRTTPALSQAQNQPLTPTPTTTGGPFRANGSSACVGTNPGTSTPDPCENDDSPFPTNSSPTSSAAPIFANNVAQGHNFVPNTGQTSDVDWLVFQVTTAYLQYTITLTSSDANALPSLVLFDPTASSVISTGVNSAVSVVSITNFVPTTTSNYYIRVLPPNVAGIDPKTLTYQIRLTTGNTVPTPTATNAAVTATTTGGPTNTPVPCRDDYEDDNSPGNAKELRPSYGEPPPFGGTPGLPGVSADSAAIQTHYICPESDIDWVYMDLVKGKAYSIYTSAPTNGLDTFIVLYTKDAAGNYIPVYSNDDYPGTALASRIDWIVPATADTPVGQFVRYYLAVKDVAGHGALNMKYNLVLQSAGNPIGTCFDQYEPDNNPGEGKEILLNEAQVHSFCPQGDRDWVKFFVKAGRSYNMSTSFPAGALGMDTSLYIWRISFDPNDPGKVIEQRLLAQNDDRNDNDLSSTVNFTVPSDGYYYAEVRNAGDIGRNALNYTLRLSSAGAPPLDNGGTATANAGARQTATAAAQTPAVTTAGTRTATTATATTATATITAAANSALQAQLARFRFGDASFQRLWFFSDLAVFSGRSQRSWEWGPTPAQSKLENYAEAAGGVRQVQYFDKARMEINNPKGDHNSKWFVTNGLLVKELVSGWVATGDNQGELKGAAQIAVAGDLTESNPAPNYASFQNLITTNGANRAENLTNQIAKLALSKDGTSSTLTTAPEQIKLVNYIKETGHNIPAVFWNYLNAKGLVYESDYRESALRDWVFTVGLPLSEPYWVKAQVNGVERDVLVQLFERRVITYTPTNPAEWRVEMANVGQHYYQWRYNANLEAAN